jgi:predicted MPP superfamily phosphohydrolase
MAQYSKLIKYNCAPNDSQKVEIYDRKGIKRGVIKIPSSLSTTIKEKPLYSFGALSDIHLCPTEKPEEAAAEQDFQKALTYYENNQDISFICVCGDMTTKGTEEELLVYKNHIDTYTTKPVYSIMGNHDTMNYSGLTGIEDRIQEYTGYPLYYTFEAGNNDLFIMLGSYREARVLSDEELDWFE